MISRRHPLAGDDRCARIRHRRRRAHALRRRPVRRRVVARTAPRPAVGRSGSTGSGPGRWSATRGRARSRSRADAAQGDHLSGADPAGAAVHAGAADGLGHLPEANFRPVATDAPFYLQIRWRDARTGARSTARTSAPSSRASSVVWPGAGAGVGADGDDAASRARVTSASSRSRRRVGPSVTGARSWTWHRDEAPAPGDAADAAAGARFDPIAFSAVNVAETQQENVRAFFAGVLLGIAGGAVIGVIVELVKIRRVRRNEPSPAD